MTRRELVTTADLIDYARRATEWQANRDYVNKELVTVTGTLYQVNQDHNSGSSFNATYYTLLSGSGGTWTVVSVSTNYTPNSHEIVKVDATAAVRTITVSKTSGFQCIVIKVDSSSNFVNAVPSAGTIENTEGAFGSTCSITNNGEAYGFLGDGTNVLLTNSFRPFTTATTTLGGPPTAGGFDGSVPRGPHTHEIRITPLALGNMGATATVDMANFDLVFVTGTLTANCAITVSNMPAAKEAQCIFRLKQDSNGSHTVSYAQTIKWFPGSSLVTNGVAPIMATPATAETEFAIYSDDGGTTKYGRHSQPIRSHSFHYNGALTSSYVGKDAEKFLYDARVVKVVPFVAGAPVSTSAVFDLDLGTLTSGAGTTMYTTQANRPAITATNRTNTSVVLPDIVVIPPNGILTVDVDTASSATDLSFTVWTIEVE